MKTTFLGLVLVLLCLVACRHEEPLEWSDTPYLNVNSPWVDSTLNALALKEKIGQLLFLDVNAATGTEPGEIIDWNRRTHFGGLQVYGLSVESYLELDQQIKTENLLSLLSGTGEQLLLNNQFTEAGEVPGGAVLRYLPESDSLRVLSRNIFREQMRSLGLNAQFNSFASLTEAPDDLLGHQYLQFVDELPKGAVLHTQDSVYWDHAIRSQLQTLQNKGIAGFVLSANFLENNHLSPVQLAQLFRNQLGFKGLLLAEASAENALLLLAGTVDVLKVNGDPAQIVQQLEEAYRSGVLTGRELEIRVSKMLQAKEWLRRQQLEATEARLADAGSDQVTYDRASVLGPVLGKGKHSEDSLNTVSETITEHFDKNRWRLLNRKFYERSSVLLHNRNQLLPFRDLYRHHFRLVHLGNESRADLEKAFRHYADFSKYYHLSGEEGRYPRLRITPDKREICVVTLNEDLDAKADSVLLEDLRGLARDREVVLLHFGSEAGLASLDTTFSLLHFPEMNKTTQELAAQILFGGASPQGKLPQDINAYFRAGRGEELPVTRLSYQIPEALGISPEKLVGIDAIAQSAIDDGAFPGCQILVARKGSVIYSKAFGYHNYDGKKKVEMTDLFDVASITKVAATTLAAMKLYEQGKFEMNDRLKNYLDCPSNSTIKNIQIKKLMIHQSGLQPHMPVVPYLLFRDTFNVGCDSFFCNQVSENYPYEVADGFYFNKDYHDRIWEDIHKISVGSQRRYRYSDANFFLVQQVLEKVSGIPLDDLVRQYFYTPLGLRYTSYRPLDNFPLDRIVPTQNDDRWRHQQVHGYVHDETAALLGGVSGHAGLFANAEDLAVLFQMLLNKGYYGDRQYLKPETIDLFTTADKGNHRGFGFDTAHPDSRSAFAESASKRSFGHTGFTGTCIWADPDNDLIFVFLSNRINPSVRNKKLFKKHIRERIHQVVYDALDTYTPQTAERQILVE